MINSPGLLSKVKLFDIIYVFNIKIKITNTSAGEGGKDGMQLNLYYSSSLSFAQSRSNLSRGHRNILKCNIICPAGATTEYFEVSILCHLH